MRAMSDKSSMITSLKRSTVCFSSLYLATWQRTFRLPMIIIQPIPGQEERNSTILTGYGAAVRADTVRQAIYYIKDFISSPEKIIGMRARINLLAYPNAARDIARFARELEGYRYENRSGKEIS